jgi:predicted RNase H-like HicB family nuclease
MMGGNRIGAIRYDGRTEAIATIQERLEMNAKYTAVIQQTEHWWIGWVEEVPGVNSQGKTREELLENLRSALGEALEMNRADRGDREWLQSHGRVYELVGSC